MYKSSTINIAPFAAILILPILPIRPYHAKWTFTRASWLFGMFGSVWIVVGDFRRSLCWKFFQDTFCNRLQQSFDADAGRSKKTANHAPSWRNFTWKPAFVFIVGSMQEKSIVCANNHSYYFKKASTDIRRPGERHRARQVGGCNVLGQSVLLVTVPAILLLRPIVARHKRKFRSCPAKNNGCPPSDNKCLWPQVVWFMQLFLKFVSAIFGCPMRWLESLCKWPERLCAGEMGWHKQQI